MLKILAGLSLLQTIAIVFLAARVAGIDSELDSAAAAQAASPVASLSPSQPQEFIPADAVIATAAPSGPDADMLRRIIREEFAMLRLSDTGAAAPAPADPAPNPRLAAAARRDLDQYISRGRIEPNEVELYFDKIAELPAAERTKAMRDLAKAINDGRIEGRL